MSRLSPIFLKNYQPDLKDTWYAGSTVVNADTLTTDVLWWRWRRVVGLYPLLLRAPPHLTAEFSWPGPTFMGVGNALLRVISMTFWQGDDCASTPHYQTGPSSPITCFSSIRWVGVSVCVCHCVCVCVCVCMCVREREREWDRQTDRQRELRDTERQTGCQRFIPFKKETNWSVETGCNPFRHVDFNGSLANHTHIEDGVAH